jgi:uncharacterized membrane protein YphA (DoxX/SURF4 family)
MRKLVPIIRTLICYLFITLFIYAAVTKLMDFETFQIQLGQSPLLASFAIPISYGIIVIELVTALLLMFDRFRKLALQFSLLLMVMFTTYIIIILNFTPFTPCSCGGVLEKLGWTEHLIFNIVFVGLALIGIKLTTSNFIWKTYIFQQTIIILIGIISVSILYSLSEKKSQYNNAFTRTYIPHLLKNQMQFNLESNAFYIAGLDDSIVYLGNYNAPLYVTLINYKKNTSTTLQVKIDQLDLPYKRVRIEIQSPYFYVGDGTIPIIFRGKINNWKAITFMKNTAYFSSFQPIDSSSIAIVTTSTQTQSNVIGLLNYENKTESFSLKLSHTILKNQHNGMFDTDGILKWIPQLNKLVYAYYYRNQIEIADRELNPITTVHTIDTISKAQITSAYYKKSNQYKLGNAVMVNRLAVTDAHFLYINSDRLGKYDDKDVLKSASIIDCYDLIDNSYQHSFYFYHQPNFKLKDFRIHSDQIVGIVDQQLLIHKIK